MATSHEKLLLWDHLIIYCGLVRNAFSLFLVLMVAVYFGPNSLEALIQIFYKLNIIYVYTLCQTSGGHYSHAHDGILIQPLPVQLIIVVLSHTPAFTHIQTHTYTHVCTHIDTHVCTHIDTPTCIHMHTLCCHT